MRDDDGGEKSKRNFGKEAKAGSVLYESMRRAYTFAWN